MMIGGEFNTPADWLRAGGAVKTLDNFAAAHVQRYAVQYVCCTIPSVQTFHLQQKV